MRARPRQQEEEELTLFFPLSLSLFPSTPYLRRLRRRHARREGERLARRDVVRRRPLGLLPRQVLGGEVPLVGHAGEQDHWGRQGGGGEGRGQGRFPGGQRRCDLCQGRRGALRSGRQGRGVGCQGGQGEKGDGGGSEGEEEQGERGGSG